MSSKLEEPPLNHIASLTRYIDLPDNRLFGRLSHILEELLPLNYIVTKLSSESSLTSHIELLDNRLYSGQYPFKRLS